MIVLKGYGKRGSQDTEYVSKFGVYSKSDLNVMKGDAMNEWLAAREGEGESIHAHRINNNHEKV